MSAPIGVGDYVECVNARQRHNAGPPVGLRVGAVYRVEAIVDPDFDPGLVLEGLRSFHYTGSYSIEHFKPIFPGGELKRLLLEKPLEVSPPEKVKADA